MNLKDRIEMAGKTHVGCVRDHNEDAISIDASLGLAILADGMGGHRGGEVASAITVSTIYDTLSTKLKSIKKGATDEASGYSLKSTAIHDAIKLANTNVFESSHENAQYRGMGTTVVVLLFYDNRFTVAHVGDSRLYRIRNGVLENITRDHSLMQELIDRGFYTTEQARKSLKKNLVTRAIGIEETVQIDVQEDVVQINDIYLLCSDGLNDMIEDELILEIIKQNSDDLEKAVTALIAEANRHGGKDNISVILARPLKSFSAKNSLFSRFFDLFS
ncbi:MAG: Stp1/IreP family PP2C-type Ser/Thr phosphatase [Gammaproteobacteria bacterium]|nr:Stp1/IreP family PP2C-type Ser/Thr phosphatase [Gammaproteobacteria bacterium]